jgi:outer membrane cobalamin receptor
MTPEDKNFHLNFSPLYFAFAFMILMLCASEVKADEIEEVIVTAQQEETVVANPVTSGSLIGAIQEDFTYPQGGYGGFVGYNERGAQTIHTSVYVNGIPANGTGSGWYDFGHDFASGQTVKVISGTNGVVYGSGSIAGAILITDTIDSGLTVRLEDGIQFARVAPTDSIEFSMLDNSMGSVRNDNDEKDNYKNKTARFDIDAGDFNLVGKYTDYKYDYDNCYTSSLSQSNDCLQDGERYNVAIRNDLLTLGRAYEKAEYFTEGDSTYVNENYRDFVRVGKQMFLSNKLNVTYGLDAEQQHYKTSSPYSSNVYEDENFGVFMSANADFVMSYNFGFRLGNDDQNALRLGIENGPWYFNIGNSFRKPNLYEKFGDAYVDGNEDLKPEEGIGYELGFGVVSLFRYEFDETIEYVAGYTTTVVVEPEVSVTDPDTGEVTVTPAVTEDVYTNATYANGGDYITQGFRFANNFGPVYLSLKYTDTEQPRVPKVSGVVQYSKDVYGVNLRIKYAVQLDREPSQYDVLPEGQTKLDDLKKLNFYATKDFNNGFVLSFKAENITNEEVEVVPFYGVEGTEYYITLNYNW